MRHLFDSNVFIALVLEAHPHHSRALKWLDDRPEGARIYFCRATQTSFLRLLTVRDWMKEQVRTNDEAIQIYQALRADPRIGLMTEEPAGLEKHWLEYASSPQPSPKRWMDAYLAAFAASARLSFVTFDRGFSVFPDLDLILLNS